MTDLVRLGAETNPECRIQTDLHGAAGHQALVGAMVQLADLDKLADIGWRLHVVQSSKPVSS